MSIPSLQQLATRSLIANTQYEDMDELASLPIAAQDAMRGNMPLNDRLTEQYTNAAQDGDIATVEKMHALYDDIFGHLDRPIRYAATNTRNRGNVAVLRFLLVGNRAPAASRKEAYAWVLFTSQDPVLWQCFSDHGVSLDDDDVPRVFQGTSDKVRRWLLRHAQDTLASTEMETRKGILASLLANDPSPLSIVQEAVSVLELTRDDVGSLMMDIKPADVDDLPDSVRGERRLRESWRWLQARFHFTNEERQMVLLLRRER